MRSTKGAPKRGSNRGTEERDYQANRSILVGEAEAARILGISPRTMYSLRTSGQIPVVRVGNRVLYRTVTLEKFAADTENREEGVA